MRQLSGWQKILLAGAAVLFPMLSCSQRSLVLIDVHAPQGVAYSNVKVVITAGGSQTTDFLGVTFDTSGVFHAGVYIPSDMTGTVALHGEVDQNNCFLGSGDASTKVASEGETTTVVPLPITPSTTPCVAGTGGSAGSSAIGGAGGAGGLVGSGGAVGAGGSVGSGGAGGLTGSAGAGGSAGSGGLGAGGVTGTGGKGGVTGAGGATATGGHGSGGTTTGSGGSPTTGSGGSPTTGSGGIKGSGGLGGGGPTGGAGGPGGVTGVGGLPTTGSGGGGGCNCAPGFVCQPGTTTCVCSQSDADACANVACGSVTNSCSQTVACPDTCPVGYSCLGNLCKQLTTTGCGGDIVATGTGLVAGTSAAPPICP